MLDRPGYLEPIYRRGQWLDLVYRSDLDPTTKLVASVVERTCNYDRRVQAQISSISDYSISRIIKTNKSEVRKHLDLLFEHGWLFDTGLGKAAKQVYCLTFSLIPLGDMRK